jgi:transcriptional regulator with XRE-family HTH domain
MKYNTNFYWWFASNAAGYTAQEICDIADLNNALLSNWWNGRTYPSTKNLIKLCLAIHRLKKKQQANQDDNKITNADLEKLYVTAMIALQKDMELYR